MASYVEVLGSSNLDSNPSFLLFFENSRYLVQVPEAFQRVCTENRIKLSKIAGIFMTKNSCTTFSGLPGLSITVADMGVKKLNIFGPPGLDRLLEAVKTFSVRSALETTVHEYDIPEQPTSQSDLDFDNAPIVWQDENLSCKAICVGYTKRTIDQSHYENNPYQQTFQHPSNHNNQNSNQQVNQTNLEVEEFKLRPEKKLKQSNTPPNEPASLSACCDFPSSAYHREDDKVLSDTSSDLIVDQPNHHIVNQYHEVYSLIYQIASVPGKFDAQKAKQIGLQPGPLFAKLKAGQPIDLTVNGEFVRVVQPEECVGPSRIGPVVCVIECPLSEWIDTLIENPVWNTYKPNHASHIRSKQSVSLMIHLAPLSVIREPRYGAWVESFGASTRHVLINESFSSATTSFTQSDRYTQTIAQLDPTSFEFSTPPIDPSVTQSPNNQLTNHQSQILDTLKQSGWPQSTFIGTMLDRFHMWANQSSNDTQSLTPAKKPSNTKQSDDEPVDPPPSIDPQLLHSLREQLTSQMSHSATHSATSSDHPESSLNSVADVVQQSSDQATIDQFNLHPAVSATDIVNPPNALALLSSLPHASDQTSDKPSDLSNNSSYQNLDVIQTSRGVPSLFFSGTGSAIPSKYRNVTGIHFDDGRPGLSGCIIDCGEGTLGQLTRSWGADKLSVNLAKLRMVFISHMHADHHLGLPSLIQAWAQIEQARREQSLNLSPKQSTDSSAMELDEPAHSIKRRLLVVGPRKLYNWLLTVFNVMHEVSPVILNPASDASNTYSLDQIKQQTTSITKFDDYFEFVANHALLQTAHEAIDQSIDRTQQHLRDQTMWKIRTVFVRHCPDAFGLILTCNTTINQSVELPVKVVYSGDTLPCQSLVDAGADATVLIHESTFEGGMEAEAFGKRHSTNQQACLIGRLMRAKCIILTHFSQRYPKISMINQPGDSSNDQIPSSVRSTLPPIVAFDLMRCDFNRLNDSVHLTNALQQLLATQKDEEDEA